MNNIQEKDWAEDDWHSHTGIDSSCDYCVAEDRAGAEKQGPDGQQDKACGGKKSESAVQK